jgi:hypothetical protein
MWVDGIKQTRPWPASDHVQFGSTGQSDDALLIGGPGADCEYRKPYDGAIDDLRLYDTALTDEQVLALMPIIDTTTTAVVEQYSTSVSTTFNDAPTTFIADIRPRPGSPGTVTWYASKNGAAEEVFGSVQWAPNGADRITKQAGTIEAGTYAFRAVWEGNANWSSSSSAPVVVTFQRRVATGTLIADPSADVPGGASTLTAKFRNPDANSNKLVAGSVDFYDTTGTGETLLGTIPLQYVGNPDWNLATFDLSSLPTGTHTYEARFPGSITFLPATGSASVSIGPQRSRLALTMDTNPLLSTQQPIAIVDLSVERKGSGSSANPLPDPSGVLEIRRQSNGSVLGSAVVDRTGRYFVTLPTQPVGSIALIAVYSGDGNYDPFTSSPVTLTVQADTVMATNVGVGYSTFYPVKDGYRDAVSIKGIRQEPISVVIRIYNSTNHIVKGYTIPSGTGSYAAIWNGRNSAGTILASGTYRVVQTLTDDVGTRLVVSKNVTLSKKRLYYYTKTLTKLGKSVSSVGTLNGGKVTAYSDGSIRIYGGSGWAGAGWQFALPSAQAYKSIAIGVYGYTGVPAGQMGAQNFTLCAYSSTWNTACFDRWTYLKGTKSWVSRSISPTDNRYGRAVRVAVSQSNGSSRVYKVRVVVTYGLLK